MLFRRFTESVLAARWVYLAGLLVVIATTVGGVVWINADFSARAFFGSDDPETAYLDGYLERWGQDDVLFVVLDGQGRSLVTRERLKAIDGLISELEDDPQVEWAMGVSRLPRVRRGPAGLWLPVPLMGTVPNVEDDSPRMDAWRAATLGDPQLVPNFLSKDGTSSSILVRLDVDTDDLAAVRPVVHRIEAMLEERGDGVRYLVGGIPAIRADVIDVIVTDQIVFVPLAATLMGLMLFVLFRSVHGVLIPGIAAGVPIAMLLGVMGWTGEAFGLLNQVLLALIPAIAVADAIHLLARYHEEVHAQIGDAPDTPVAVRESATVEAMSHLGVACFLTSFTTVIGFLSLRAARMPVLSLFGTYAAVGVALAYFTVVFVIPLAIQATRGRARRPSEGGPMGSFLQFCGRTTVARPWSWVALGGVVVVAAAAAGTLVEVDPRLTETFVESHPTTQANRMVDEELGGVLALEYELNGSPGAFHDPELLRALSGLDAITAEVPAVRSSWSVAAAVASTSLLMGGPEEVPASPKLLQRLLGLLDDAGSLAPLLSEDADRGRLIVRTVDVGATEFERMGKEFEGQFATALAPYGVVPHLTGTSFVAYRGMSRVAVDLRNSLLVAFGVIGLVITVLFRSPRMGLLSLVPNVIPLLVAYGAMGVFGWSLEPAAGLVFTVAIGISVDNAIHILARFREETGRGRGVEEAVTAALKHSGRAIIVTSIILTVGFAVNVHSSSPANALFGKMGGIAIVSAMFCALFVLPSLLVLVFRGEETGAEAAAPVVA